MNYDLVYEPGDDTFLIAEQLKKFHDIRVLDMGSGSGYLAEILIKNNCNVLAADINKKSVELCRKKGRKLKGKELKHRVLPIIRRY